MEGVSRGRRAITVLIAGAAACATVGSIGGRGAHAAGPAPGFGEPTPSGIQGNGFEQDVRVDPSRHAVYTSAPASLSSTISYIWRSLDDGKTFKWVPATSQPDGKLPTCAGGGDSELGVDSAGHLYFNDLTLANFSVARSDDQGVTFSARASCAGVPDTAVDRQWYATHGDPTNGGQLALAYDRANQGNPAECTGVATAGNNILTLNLSPISATAGTTAGEEFGPAQTITCDEGIMGNDEMFDYGSTNGGLKVFVVHDNANLDSVSMGRCDVVGISTTAPTGFTNCQDKLISSFSGSVTGGSFATMAVDTAGNIYAVWEQATGSQGAITSDTLLKFAVSTDTGNTWTVKSLPTPGLLQNVFAWPGAGDPGRVDVAWYGTPAAHACNTASPPLCAGPDTTKGDWGLYMTQTLDSGTNWSAPVLASEHFNHRGTIQTVMGGQNGDRTLGDFIQMRIGAQGEANISYADSNNINEGSTPEAFFVRQNSGPSVFATPGTVSLPAAPVNCATDVGQDATYDALGVVGPNNPNLDILQSCITQPDSTHYKVTMQVANLTSLTPGVPAPGGSTLIWQTQWQRPSSTETDGGALEFVYMESVDPAQTPTCWAGESATEPVGGGVTMTYPGLTPVTGSTACQFTATAPGTITITVPTSAFDEPNPLSTTLFSVTASTQTLPSGNAETPSPVVAGVNFGIGGQLFNLIDVAPSYDFNPNQVTIPEAPWAPLLLAGGGMVGMLVLVSRRRRRAA